VFRGDLSQFETNSEPACHTVIHEFLEKQRGTGKWASLPNPPLPTSDIFNNYSPKAR